MQLKLLNRKILPNIPSASGIELYNNKLYIIGDDSSWLYILDKNLNQIERIALLKKEKLSDQPIEKNKKPDFEAMTFAKVKGEDILFVFGSGSKPKKRDKLIIVFPEKQHAVIRFSLENLYNTLRKKEIEEEYKLNIEAAAANSNNLYLFQRGNVSGRNLLFSFPLSDFADYVLNDEAKIPNYTVSSFILPEINSIRSGFSGASMLDDKKILFSTSVEDTKNEIDDGAVLGSFIGILNPQTKEMDSKPIQEGTDPLPLKIESVCVIQTQEKIHTLYAVTDSDGGDSELLEIELTE